MSRKYPVSCNCYKCKPHHYRNCTCIKCTVKLIRNKGLLPSTIEYNTKVDIVNKTISIKAIAYNLMKDILIE